jgi:hypothetical protein
MNSDVRVNDVFFSLHANLMTTIGIIQICRYDRGHQLVSRTCKLLVSLVIAMAATYGAALVVSTQFGATLPCRLPVSTLGFLYFLSYIKLAMTLIKYIPQVIAILLPLQLLPVMPVISHRASLHMHWMTILTSRAHSSFGCLALSCC